jgi:hypothetical protein
LVLSPVHEYPAKMKQGDTSLKYKCLLLLLLSTFMILLNLSCRNRLPDYTEINQNIDLTPDFTSIPIPPNIAPLNFRVNEPAGKYLIWFHNSNGIEFFVRSGNHNIEIPARKWSKLLAASVSKELFIDVFLRRSQKWIKFKTIKNYVTPDSIDRYLVYRLIEPGFEGWKKMGIYQRDIESFKESPVMINGISDDNCINCHSFCKNNSNTMMFHLRSKHAGTVIFRDNNLSKVNTKTEKTISAGVYPSWHPSGNYIAYSVNNIFQSFHAIPTKRIEVYDTLSDIIVYDTNENIVEGCEAISDPGKLETFPTWSPDGRYLYFCSAKKPAVNKNSQLRYDLFRIAFDSGNCRFGTVDTICYVSDRGKSVSFPRISPDGRYLLFCMSDYGNFTIWHPETDLFLLDLTSGNISIPAINSNKTESYHSWSSTGRWIVFSSRRGDGLYTRLYLSYFDSLGVAHKPFILPQKKPGFYFNFLKSYNIPELVTARVELTPRKLAKIVESAPVNATFKSSD